MNHPLDNPAWNALASHNSPLGFINQKSAYFDPDVSPFAALSEPSAEALQELLENSPTTDFFILVSNQKFDTGQHWKSMGWVDCYQMVYKGDLFPEAENPALRALTEPDVPQMLALTRLTNPGPFAARTIEFGHYEGIFDGEKLVAMCGQRLYPDIFTEISAVCTHPDYLGKGHAQFLMKRQINRMLERENVPFLHVREDNARAINVYKHLGFEIRGNMYFNPMQKA